MPFTADQITQAAQSHLDESTYGAVGNVTKCNFFVRDVVETILAQTRPDLRTNSSGGIATANDQFDNLKASADWSSQNFPSDQQGKFNAAFAAANNGTLVIVAYKNPDPTASGHIAIIVPAAAMESSSTWSMNMPFIAQAGKLNPRGIDAEANVSVFASLKLSWGFTPDIAPQMEVFFYVGH